MRMTDVNRRLGDTVRGKENFRVWHVDDGRHWRNIDRMSGRCDPKISDVSQLRQIHEVWKTEGLGQIPDRILLDHESLHHAVNVKVPFSCSGFLHYAGIDHLPFEVNQWPRARAVVQAG